MSWVDVGCMVGILMCRCGAEAEPQTAGCVFVFFSHVYSLRLFVELVLVKGAVHLFGWHGIRCTWVPPSLAPLTEGEKTKKRLII